MQNLKVEKWTRSTRLDTEGRSIAYCWRINAFFFLVRPSTCDYSQTQKAAHQKQMEVKGRSPLRWVRDEELRRKGKEIRIDIYDYDHGIHDVHLTGWDAYKTREECHARLSHARFWLHLAASGCMKPHIWCRTERASIIGVHLIVFNCIQLYL